MLRSRWTAGIAVVSAVAVGAVGGALIGVPGLSGAQPFPTSATNAAATNAATPSARPMPTSPLLAAAAKALNLTTQQLLTKLSDGKTTIADVAQQQHVGIQTVIAAMTAADGDRISNIVNKPWPKFGRGPGGGQGGGPGAGANGPAARGGLGFGVGLGGLGRFGVAALDPVAKALGITPAELKTDLGKGQTIAQIATAKNVNVDTLITTLVGDASAKIDQAVTAKHLTPAQADKLKAALKTAITDFVNNGFPKGPKGPMGGGFGFRGRGGFGGPKPGSTPTPPTA